MKSQCITVNTYCMFYKLKETPKFMSAATDSMSTEFSLYWTWNSSAFQTQKDVLILCIIYIHVFVKTFISQYLLLRESMQFWSLSQKDHYNVIVFLKCHSLITMFRFSEQYGFNKWCLACCKNATSLWRATGIRLNF